MGECGVERACEPAKNGNGLCYVIGSREKLVITRIETLGSIETCHVVEGRSKIHCKGTIRNRKGPGHKFVGKFFSSGENRVVGYILHHQYIPYCPLIAPLSAYRPRESW
jgi:hypothetical protein